MSVKWKKPEKGSLSVVGLGPGGKEWMSEPAVHAIEKAHAVCGYKTYINLIQELIRPDQEIVQTGMTKEKDRCEKAIALALSGKDVALVCSGDPGIYALSGLVYELLKKQGITSKELTVKVIPGIPALSACAALLGAPLIHDFAVISLSDLLTPWHSIEKRIEAAATSDFVIVLYNPRSKKRRDHLPKAFNVIAKHRKGQTPVGIVNKAMRKGQEVHITTLDEVRESGPDTFNVGMQSLVIIGNSKSFIWDGKIITPRGYEV